MTHRILVGFLTLILATCSGWCTRLHHHDAGLGHAEGDPGQGVEAPRPVNDDNCACAGALPHWESASVPGVSGVTPLPFDHPFAIAIVWPPALLAVGERLGVAGEIHPPAPSATAALRALRLRC